MLRHSVLCRDSGARHCVATRLCSHDIDALSRQCDVTLRRDREDHVRATYQVKSTQKMFSFTIEIFLS